MPSSPLCAFRLLLAAVLLLLGTATTAAAAGDIRQPLRDAVSYDADLTTTGDGRSWSGTERIVVRNAGRRSLDRVWLRLWGNGPLGCTPRAVTVTAVAGGRKRRLLRDCSAVEILLDAPLPSAASTTLTLSLDIVAPAIQDRFGAAEGLQLFGNALPVVAQRDRGGWRLPAYSAFGESFVSSWARFDLTLRHPAGLAVAASGTTTTVPDPAGVTAVTRSQIDARDTFWAIGAMTERTVRSARGTVVRAWSPPGAGGDREDAAAQSVAALDEIERHLPDYPYPEFDVIVARIDAGGGMEYPGAVLTDGSDDVTRHELGHQWFYNLLGNDQFREPWIDEGLTSFIEYTWSSAEMAEPTCYEASRLAVPGPTTFVTGSMTYWNKHVRQYGIVYNNPVCALRRMRSLVGRRAFDRTMRSLVERKAQGVLTGAELRAAFRAVGGRRADAIWPRWGLGPGR